GGAAPRSWLLPGLFIASFLWLAGKCARDKRWEYRKPAAVILALCAVLFLCICFTPSGLDPEHPFVLWPYAILVIALGFFSLFEAVNSFRFGRWLALGCLLAAAIWSWRFDGAYFSALKRTGGEGLWTSAPSDAAHYLEKERAHAVVCLSWGMAEQIYFISKGKIIPDNGFSFRGGVPPRLLAAYRGWLRDPATLYLSWAGPQSKFDGRAALEEELRKERKTLILEKTFSDGRGVPILFLYKTGTRGPFREKPPKVAGYDKIRP
ncbi:MAG: hypothetical protein KGL04_03505, partial [Elusimicrobia bacterium]|nr:hypothetical protein [Elusimicrobiota bacterium]